MPPGSWFGDAADRVARTEASVAVIGCGYVGLTLALESARVGFTVRGIETDDRRAKELRGGSNPVPDVAIPGGELAALRDAGSLVFEIALTEPADIYIICVNTPLRDGSPDLSYVEAAAESVAKVLSEGALVVLESTTYPGTTEELVQPILEETSGLVAGRDFALAHSPERIDPGNRDWGMRNTPKVVGGLTAENTELAAAFYSRFCDSVHVVSSPRAAEITKLFENTYREVNIALANEMAIVCHDFDIDPWEVLRAAASKPFGFTPFRPGPGVGGHCLLPGERVFVRSDSGVEVRRVEDLWPDFAARSAAPRQLGTTSVLDVDGMEIASLATDVGDWDELTAIGRRPYSGATVKLTLRDGRRIGITADHPMLVARDGTVDVVEATHVSEGDLLPIWRGDQIWDALLNPRIDLIETLDWSALPNAGIRLSDGDWRPWRDRIAALVGTTATQEVIRHGRLPASVFVRLERAGEIEVSHDDLVIWTGRGRSARPFPAVVELTPDLARLIGYYLAEGCVSGAQPRVVFTFHRHEAEAIEDVQKLLGSLGLTWSVYNDPSWLSTQIKVGSVVFAMLLRNILRCGTNSYDARIPPALLGSSAAHRRELLSGLVRGDGSVYTQDRFREYTRRSRRYRHRFRHAEVGYWTVSQELADAVEYLFLSLGYVPAVHRRQRQRGVGFRIHGGQDLGWLADLLSDDKRRRLSAHVAGAAQRPSTRGRSFVRVGELHTVPVVRIERDWFEGDVYSLETTPSHTFAATHGILVHNCIPVDPQYLAWRVRAKVGRQFRLLETASDVNQRMPSYVAQRAAEILNQEGKALRGARIVLLGVAYKGGSGDVRESPALRVADRLVISGADVVFHDPHVPSASINDVVQDSQSLDAELLSGSDLVIILTDHPDVDYAWVVATAPCTYDTRGVTALLNPAGGTLYRF